MVEGYREHFQHLLQAEEEVRCCDVCDCEYYDIERALARGTALSELQIIHQRASDIYTFEASYAFASRLKPGMDLVVSKTHPNIDGEYQNDDYDDYNLATVRVISPVQHDDTYKITMQWDGLSSLRLVINSIKRRLQLKCKSLKIFRRKHGKCKYPLLILVVFHPTVWSYSCVCMCAMGCQVFCPIFTVASYSDCLLNRIHIV